VGSVAAGAAARVAAPVGARRAFQNWPQPDQRSVSTRYHPTQQRQIPIARDGAGRSALSGREMDALNIRSFVRLTARWRGPGTAPKPTGADRVGGQAVL